MRNLATDIIEITVGLRQRVETQIISQQIVAGGHPFSNMASDWLTRLTASKLEAMLENNCQLAKTSRGNRVGKADRASYGASNVRILKKIDRVIMAPHCI